MKLFTGFRFGKAEITILSAFVFLILLGIGVSTIPAVATWYGKVTVYWTELALRYGYWGAFFSALVGSLTLVIVFPYTIVVIFLAAQGLNPIYLGILMGLGATIGQMSGYIIGASGSRYVQRKKPETYDAISKIVTYRPLMTQWLLFVFAVTPLPDDVVFIPLGILRYPWWKIIFPTVVGKVITGLVVSAFGFFFKHTIDTTIAGPTSAVVSQLATLAAIAFMVYLLVKLDWQKLMRRLLKTDSVPTSSSK